MDLEEKLFRENFQISSMSKRVASFSIDELIISLIFITAFSERVLSSQSMLQSIEIMNSLVPYMIILKIAYHGFFTFMYGKTVGKMVMKIRVIDIYTFDKPNLFNSFIRAIARIFSEMFFYIGFIYAYFSPFRQTFHDKIVKVIVVDD